jgi:hypothetical protein
LISVVGTTKPKIIGCVVTNPRLREPNFGDRRHRRDDATRRADDPGPSTNVGYIHRREKRYDSTAAAAADTVFAQQRRSGCGTLLVALLVLAIITAM